MRNTSGKWVDASGEKKSLLLPQKTYQLEFNQRSVSEWLVQQMSRQMDASVNLNVVSKQLSAK